MSVYGNDLKKKKINASLHTNHVIEKCQHFDFDNAAIIDRENEIF